MSDLMTVGAKWGAGGTLAPFTSGTSGAQRTTDAHARYLDAVLAGRVFKLQGASLAPTAYVGAAGGTPLLAIHNPVASGKIASLLCVGVAERVTASAAGTATIAVWSGASVVPTGTFTAATSAYSLAASGSQMLGVVNAAMTGSTALAMAMPLFTYYWATAAGASIAPGFFDIGGLVTAAPGNQIAIGATVVPTATTWDIVMYWEELPSLVQV